MYSLLPMLSADNMWPIVLIGVLVLILLVVLGLLFRYFGLWIQAYASKADISLIEKLLDGENGGLGVEGIEDSFDEYQVHPALYQTANGLGIGDYQLVEGHIAKSRIADVRRNRCGAVGGPQHAGHEARLSGRSGAGGGGGLPRQPGRRQT